MFIQMVDKLIGPKIDSGYRNDTENKCISKSIVFLKYKLLCLLNGNFFFKYTQFKLKLFQRKK